jgi:hypothetical protein
MTFHTNSMGTMSGKKEDIKTTKNQRKNGEPL